MIGTRYPIIFWQRPKLNIYFFVLPFFDPCSESFRMFAGMATSEWRMFSPLLRHLQDLGRRQIILQHCGFVPRYSEGQVHTGGATAVGSWVWTINDPNLCRCTRKVERWLAVVRQLPRDVRRVGPRGAEWRRPLRIDFAWKPLEGLGPEWRSLLSGTGIYLRDSSW